MANPLTMESAVHSFALLPTSKQAVLLTREGENHATQQLVDRMRAAYNEQWAALTLALHRSPRWADIDADIVRECRDILGLNRRTA